MTTIHTLAAHEAECPEHCRAVVNQFEDELDSNGRRPLQGHRTPCTPTTAYVDLQFMLDGQYGLGAQLHAYRRIRNIKYGQRVKWSAAAVDLMATGCQIGDPQITRERAERIAQQADVNKAAAMLKAWLFNEPAV